MTNPLCSMLTRLFLAGGLLAVSIFGPAALCDDARQDAQAKDQTPPVKLSVKNRMPSLYEVASRKGHEDRKAKYRSSENYPVQLAKDETSGEEGKLSLIVDTKETPQFLKYEGISVRLVNRTGKLVTLSAIDSYLYMVQEAQDENGAWKTIERSHPGTGPRDCGVGMHHVFLEPNEFWNITAPRFSGSIKTKIRFRLKIESEKPGGTLLYSEPFDGEVNPEQLRP